MKLFHHLLVNRLPAAPVLCAILALGWWYSAAAPLDSPGSWPMHMVAFKAADTRTDEGICDLNQDGVTNVLDVQLATAMNLGSLPCTVSIGGVAMCTVALVNAVRTAAVGGGCVTPVLTVTPSTFSLGDIITANNNVQGGTVTNIGTGDVMISDVTVSGTGFRVSGLSLPLTLSSGQSAPFNIMFALNTTDSVTGNLIFTSNALNSPVTVSLIGAGDAVSKASHSVALTWTPSVSANIVTYQLYRITSSSSTAPPPPYPFLSAISASTCSATNCSYTDSTVQAGHSYWYYAVAVDKKLDRSRHSNTAQAIVP
jgi:hypothetical protein